MPLGILTVHPHACGEHTTLPPSPSVCPVHPHACGEHVFSNIRGVTIAVHPHACGEHNPSHRLSGSAGGSSPRLWGTHSLLLPCNQYSSVHPHACGEHPALTVRPYGQCGSSPRLWGTLEAYYEDADEMRFIPTPVGNTITVGIASIIWSVHPHACGEHKRAQVRFPLLAVHPHACGEHGNRKGLRGQGRGSSPRLWGTHVHAHAGASQHRFIPTPVGNTA